MLTRCQSHPYATYIRCSTSINPHKETLRAVSLHPQLQACRVKQPAASTQLSTGRNLAVSDPKPRPHNFDSQALICDLCAPFSLIKIYKYLNTIQAAFGSVLGFPQSLRWQNGEESVSWRSPGRTDGGYLPVTREGQVSHLPAQVIPSPVSHSTLTL